MKKKIRVAAIIETPVGILLVQDSKDKYRENTLRELGLKAAKAGAENNHSLFRRIEYAMEIVRDGRYSLPGGKIEKIDYTNAEAEDLLKLDRPLDTDEEIDKYIKVIKEAVCREVDEELGLALDDQTLQPILEIQGRERDHIICIGHAKGVISLNQSEISGIGLLDDPPAVALNETFFQAHVVKLFGRYVRDPQRRSFYAPHYLSRINVSEDIVDEWYMDMLRGYQYRSAKVRRKLSIPSHPSSSPNFIIYDAEGQPVNPMQLDSFTNAKRARIVPPSSTRGKKTIPPEAAHLGRVFYKHFTPALPGEKAGIPASGDTNPELLEDLPSLVTSIAQEISSTMEKRLSSPASLIEHTPVSAKKKTDPPKAK